MTGQPTLAFPVKRLKHVVSLRRSHTEGIEDDRPYVGLENIASWTGKLLPSYSASPIGESASPSNAFEPGDVLFGKLRPYLAKVWVAEFAGRSTTECLVMQPVQVERRFLKYLCLNRDFIDAVNASTFGSKMPRADWQIVGNVSVPAPEARRQCVIADYLDREMERLNALISAKEQVLDLLAEKRRAIIACSVTRGLDPSVPFRESGVSWLGEIPAQWKVRKIAWLFRQRDHRGEPNLRLLEVSLKTGVVARQFSDERIESTAADFNTYKVARRGDVVFNKMRMWQGAVGVAPEDGLVSPDYVVAEPVGPLTCAYANMLFQTAAFSAECARHSHGIVWDRLRLYWAGFRDIEVPLPPVQEQVEIVERIAFETKRLDELSEAAKSTIVLLKERRAALIAAAVTGQIDVESET